MAGMTADAVYVLLGDEIVLLTQKIEEMGDWEPVEHKGTVQTAEDLPVDAKKGWMYNIATDSIYGAAGMNVVMTSEGWDPLGPIINMGLYLSKKEAQDAYQPKGNYLTSIPQAAGDVLGGIKADQKTDNEIVPAKIDPETGRLYVPELPGSEDLSKETTAQQILTKLQALTPLIQELASSGIANSVNGFSFIYGTDGSVTMTYTPDGAAEAEMAVLPTGSTQLKIAKATEEIANSLKIIAGKEDA